MIYTPHCAAYPLYLHTQTIRYIYTDTDRTRHIYIDTDTRYRYV